MHRRLVAIIVTLLILIWWIDLNRRAPDPYAVCDGKPTQAERAQCRSIVSFALSAGW